MQHTRCSSCDTVIECNHLIKVYRSHFAVTPDRDGLAAELWCPACYLEFKGAAVADIQEIYAIDCHPCAGPAGLTFLREKLAEFDAELSAGLIGMTNYHCLSRAGRREVATYQLPGTAPPPRRNVITLEPGEKRCLCNTCERLTVVGGALA